MPTSSQYIEDLKENDIELCIIPLNISPLKSILNLNKIIKTIKPKIIQNHFVNEYVFVLTPLIAKLNNVNKIFYMQHCNPELRKKSIKSLFFNQYNKIFCVSKYIQENLINAGVKSTVAILQYLGLISDSKLTKPNEIQFEKLKNIPHEDTILMCIGFDDPIKGVDILIKSFSMVIKKNKNIHLILIGVTPESKLKDMSRDLRIEDNVHFLGIVDNAQQLLKNADIYIQPSRNEGLSLSILEAMSKSLPVIAFKVGGISELVINNKTGFLVEPENKMKLAEKIDLLINNLDLRKELGKNAYERYKNYFSADKSIDKLITEYYKL